MRESGTQLLLLIILLAQVACKPSPAPPFCLPTFQINEIGDTTETFLYQARKIVEWNRRSEGKRNRYFYEDGLLVREELSDFSGKPIESWTFSYNQRNQLVKRVHYRSKGEEEEEEVAFTEYFYEKGELRRSRSFDPRKDPFLQTEEIYYEWNNMGLLTRMSFMEAQPHAAPLRVAETRQFFYDTQINPFDSIGWRRIPGGKHNLTALIYTVFIYSPSGEDTSFVHFADSLWYNYNESEYPVQVMQQSKTGELSTQQIGYACEE